MLSGNRIEDLLLRLEIHPDMRMSYSDVQRLSLLEVLRRHAILDQIDSEKEEQQAKANRG
jgi:hypothetical protein